MKKSINLWMMTAVLFFFGCTVLLSSCKDDDDVDITSTPTGKALTANVWTFETETSGKLTDGESYSDVLERYLFNTDGTGRWSRYYFNDDAELVCLDGGITDGDFTYSIGGDGKVNVRLNSNLDEIQPFNRELTLSDGQLIFDGKTFEADTDGVMAGACNEWDDEEHMGAAEPLEDSNRIYGVGYGYNFMADNSQAVCKQILDSKYNKYNLDPVRGTEGINSDISQETYTGQSLTELANDLSVNAKVAGGMFGFKGEVGAAFKNDFRKNSLYEYALTIINVKLVSVTLEPNLDEVKEHLNKGFEAAVKGKTKTYQGKHGLYNLVRDYGTHFIYRAGLGGRVRYSNTVDVSKIKGQYSLEAYAKASYKALALKGEASVDDKFSKSYEENKTAVTTQISVVGGTPETVLNLVNKGDAETFQKWMETLGKDNYKNTCVMSVEGVYPIWELVDDTERAAEIRDYIKDGQYEKDMSAENDFKVGAIGKIESVSKLFSKEDDANGTLVKDIEISGKVVARVCKEFIPMINSSTPSLVLYPVVDNVPKYNMGYFIGNESTAPCRVFWSDTTATPTIIPLTREKTIGAQDEIYILGNSFLHQELDAITIANGTVVSTSASGVYMEAKGLNSKGEAEDHKYPVVKLFNHVWTRENLSYYIEGASEKTSDNQVYYKPDLIVYDYRKKLPSGWRLPNRLQMEKLLTELKNRNVSQPARKLGKGGVTGFNAEWLGWMQNTTVNEKGLNAHFWGVQCDAKGVEDYTHHYYMRLDNETGNVEVIYNPPTGGDRRFSVRLYEDVKW